MANEVVRFRDRELVFHQVQGKFNETQAELGRVTEELGRLKKVEAVFNAEKEQLERRLSLTEKSVQKLRRERDNLQYRNEVGGFSVLYTTPYIYIYIIYICAV